MGKIENFLEFRMLSKARPFLDTLNDPDIEQVFEADLLKVDRALIRAKVLLAPLLEGGPSGKT